MVSSENTALVWFRDDLRIEDNPALHAARESGAALACLYVLDRDLTPPLGGARKWWLHHSLTALRDDLREAGAELILREGPSEKTVGEVAASIGASAVFWNRRYFKPHRDLDERLKAAFEGDDVVVKTFNGNLLREPWEIKTSSGGHYKVFSPFWRALQDAGPARADLAPNMRKINGVRDLPGSDDLDDWALPPRDPNWAKEFEPVWTPGEQGARDRLNAFLREHVDSYAHDRNRPDLDHTSRLSPHLTFGEISPLKIWRETRARIESGEINESPAMTFLSELGWREFSYVQLFFNDALPSEPLRGEFADYPWRADDKQFDAWTKGETGYPIVDAGLRQLWRTGWMHNRVRMIVGSFLVKDLLIPWQRGEEWFRDTLVDHDLASNSASWQWVAGCGADAAPYFRIFNPVTQGEKFDPNGDYIREFAPELADLPDKHIHAPWKAPADTLKKAGVELGGNYPHPVVDHGEARKRALEGYEEIKSS